MSIDVLPEIEKTLFPLRNEELTALEASVLSEGIRDPLVVWPSNGKQILIDGHNRYRLAQKHGLKFNVQEKHFVDIEEALAWIDQNQLARRNLTDEQRLLVLGRMYERQKKAATGFADRDMSGAQNKHRQKTAEKIASLAGVGQATVRRAAEFAKAVDAIKEVAPEAAEKILKGEVKDAVTELPKLFKKNPDIIPKVAEKIVSGESKKVKQATTELKREASKTILPPQGKYRVIYADPPWEYSNTGFTTSAEQQYPTMPTEEICDLPIKDLADENAVLFLWATNPLLEDALKVCKAWGFDYKTNFAWVKNQHTGGFYCYGQHELLLVAVRGSLLPNSEGIRSSVINAVRREHSRKPDEVYGIIEAMYNGPYIELFARTEREGWAGWGIDYGIFQSAV